MKTAVMIDMVGCHSHVIKKESINELALMVGASVPLGVFAAPSVKFLGTLARSDRQVYVANDTSNIFSAMMNMDSFSLLQKGGAPTPI